MGTKKQLRELDKEISEVKAQLASDETCCAGREVFERTYKNVLLVLEQRRAEITSKIGLN